MSGSKDFSAFPWMNPSNSKKPNAPSQPSPGKKRGSLADLFGGLEISTTKSNTLSNTIKRSFSSSSFPNWHSISKGTSPAMQVNFTIKMRAGYVQYSSEQPFNLPSQLFDEVAHDIDQIRKGCAHVKVAEALNQELINSMIELVFSSNLIERAGLNLTETVKICERIFNGEAVKAEDFDERSEYYASKLQSLIYNGNPNAKDHVIRSRREVIQHALALQHIIQKIAIDNEIMTEELLCETHRILTKGVDAPSDSGKDISSNEYGGKYRKVVVMAGNSCFVPPNKIKQAMKGMLVRYNQDLIDAENEGILDPMWLAAKYCNEFVNIHPFVDGNGRMCRLILNAILLKYAGVVVNIGEYDAERTEYLGIARRSTETMEGPGELAVMVLKKSVKRFRTLKGIVDKFI